jgi:hypothetical protein
MGLSVIERVKKFGKLYVQNMMADPPATVICHFRVPGRQKPHILQIPPGPYPYQIYPSRLPESAIMEGSDELIRFIEQGVLKIIPGKPARKILADPEVREEVKAQFSRANSPREQRRWAREQKAIADAMPMQEDGTVPTGAVTANPEEYVRGPRQAPRMSMMPQSPLQQLMQGMNNPSMAPSRAAHQLAIAGGDEGVNPKVLGLMASYMPERDGETLRKLKSMRSMLTHKDFNMILGRAGMGSQTGMWAQRQMERSVRGAR